MRPRRHELAVGWWERKHEVQPRTQPQRWVAARVTGIDFGDRGMRRIAGLGEDRPIFWVLVLGLFYSSLLKIGMFNLDLPSVLVEPT